MTKGGGVGGGESWKKFMVCVVCDDGDFNGDCGDGVMIVCDDSGDDV